MLGMLSSSTGHARHRSDTSPNATSSGESAPEPQQSLSHSRLLRRNSTFEHSSAFSPFDRLPVELHAEIFSHCLDAFPHLEAHDEPPATIARVCSAWRALVYSTPRLWASFEIEVQDCQDGSDSFGILADPYPPSSPPPANYGDPRHARYVVKLLNSVQIWLERSRNHPLSVRVIHMPSTPIPGRLSGQLLAMLVTHARRWRNVEFMLPSTSLGAVQGLFPEDFPSLKHLKVHMKGQWNGRGGAVVQSGFASGMLSLPWTQLTTVDLRLDHAHLMNLDAYLDLLSDAPSLYQCSFNAICAMSVEASKGWSSASATDHRSNYSADGQNHRVLRLPSLERLHLVLQGEPSAQHGLGVPGAAAAVQLLAAQQGFLPPAESLVSFLSLFGSCKLTHLHLDWLIDPLPTPLPQTNANGLNGQWNPTIHSKLQSFLRGLRPTLRSLQLSYLPLGEEQLLQCLAQLSGSGPSSTGVQLVGMLDESPAWQGGGESSSPSKLETLDLRFPIADHELDPITDRFFKSLTLEDSQGPQLHSTSIPGAAQTPEAGSSSSTSKISTHFELLRRNAQTALGVGQPASAAAASQRSQVERIPPRLRAVSSGSAGRGVLHFPMLERIHIHCSGERCTSKALIQLIQSRTQPRPTGRKLNGLTTTPSATLKHLRLYSMTPVLPDAERYAEGWKKAGVDVAVESVVLM